MRGPPDDHADASPTPEPSFRHPHV
jgi:hypothetical protein